MKTSKKINLDYFYQIKYEIEYIGKLSTEDIEFPINNVLSEIKSEIPLLACVCYIEGLSKICFRKNGRDDLSGEYFIKGLIKLSNIPIFGAIHSKILLEYVKHKNEIIDKDIKIFLRLLIGKKKFYTRKYFLDLIRKSPMTSDAKKYLKNQIYEGRGTYAFLAYKQLRNMVVHELESRPLSFSLITFRGEAIPRLDFEICYKALNNIYENVKRRLLAVD